MILAGHFICGVEIKIMPSTPAKTTQLKRRRGTAASHATFTGALGEFTFDTTNKTVRVHDGRQVGGFILLRLNVDGSLSIGQTKISADGSQLTFGDDANVQIVNGELLCWDETVENWRPFGCSNGQPIFGAPI